MKRFIRFVQDEFRVIRMVLRRVRGRGGAERRLAGIRSRYAQAKGEIRLHHRRL